MSGPTPKERMLLTSETIATAVTLIREELPTIDAFLKECRMMDNVGAIFDPTLFNNSERRAVSALLEPLFKSAKQLVATYDEQATRGRALMSDPVAQRQSASKPITALRVKHQAEPDGIQEVAGSKPAGVYLSPSELMRQLRRHTKFYDTRYV